MLSLPLQLVFLGVVLKINVRIVDIFQTQNFYFISLACAIKLFFVLVVQNVLFAIVGQFKPSLIFASKNEAYPSGVSHGT